jgi:peptide methionine sulfoxide reductase MsrA
MSLRRRDIEMGDNAETAVLAGGCAWVMQQLLRQPEGVISTRTGFMGGENDNPTEEDNIGHAEVVEVVFDPARPGKTVTEISEALVFWAMGPEDQDYFLRFPHGCKPPFPRQQDKSENVSAFA